MKAYHVAQQNSTTTVGVLQSVLCTISLAPSGKTPSSNIDAGIMVLSSPPMARKLSVDIPQLAVPETIIDMIERDRMAGVGSDVRCVRSECPGTAHSG